MAGAKMSTLCVDHAPCAEHYATENMVRTTHLHTLYFYMDNDEIDTETHLSDLTRQTGRH